MLPLERRNQILRLVQERGTLTIAELREIFRVSEMTIHRDLAKLQETGTVQKTYGGVVAKEFAPLEPDYATRSRAQVAQKEAIGRLAAQYVQEGDTILVDASTTCLAMIRHLKTRRNITVFTTGLLAEMELLGCTGITMHSTGGLLSHQTGAYVGPHTVAFLKGIHADKYFLSANSVDIEHGVTDPLLLEAEVKSQCAAAADQVFLLADCSKIGRVSTMRSVPLARVHLLITDSGCPTAFLQKLANAGIKYVIAPTTTE